MASNSVDVISTLGTVSLSPQLSELLGTAHMALFHLTSPPSLPFLGSPIMENQLSFTEHLPGPDTVPGLLRVAAHFIQGPSGEGMVCNSHFVGG